MRLFRVLRQGFDFGAREVAHWFPGHMARGVKQMKARLHNVDCIMEVHDARISFFAFVEISNTRIYKHLKEKGVENIIYTDCTKDENIRQILPKITELIGSSQRFQRAEIPECSILVVGVPNVGKSSLINSLRRLHLKKGKASRVGAEPGITRAVLSRIQVSENPLLYLLDSPGVLSPHIETVETGMKLALCGTILDHLVGEDIMADYLLYTLNQKEQYRYVEKYGLDGPCPDIESLLKKIALKLGKTQKVKALTGVGDVNITVPNYSAAAYDFIRTYRRGELGQMTLD
ncbi:mitochondrial ribosome-associated GTPase 1 [Pelobates cultripes]|uniref:Mitochondrial GTPase 1 n=1 Tax=Pelobates cultripes TaxID=61616 RepID=A0AAD1WNI4_PELCU|nr:mitochondrial ribosome-associated GTPase 1 [Pelobates cultripes]